LNGEGDGGVGMDSGFVMGWCFVVVGDVVTKLGDNCDDSIFEVIRDGFGGDWVGDEFENLVEIFWKIDIKIDYFVEANE